MYASLIPTLHSLSDTPPVRELRNSKILNLKRTPISAESISLPEIKTIYPPPFAALVQGRDKRKLGEHFGLINFGINLAKLAPGACSALLHHHSQQDEFIYILEGAPTLVLGEQEFLLSPVECMGIKAGTGLASQLINKSSTVVSYIEVGDRSEGNEVEYPNDDLKLKQLAGGSWPVMHKDGRPY